MACQVLGSPGDGAKGSMGSVNTVIPAAVGIAVTSPGPAGKDSSYKMLFAHGPLQLTVPIVGCVSSLKDPYPDQDNRLE